MGSKDRSFRLKKPIFKKSNRDRPSLLLSLENIVENLWFFMSTFEYSFEKFGIN